MPYGGASVSRLSSLLYVVIATPNDSASNLIYSSCAINLVAGVYRRITSSSCRLLSRGHRIKRGKLQRFKVVGAVGQVGNLPARENRAKA